MAEMVHPINHIVAGGVDSLRFVQVVSVLTPAIACPRWSVRVKEYTCQGRDTLERPDQITIEDGRKNRRLDRI